VMAVSGDGSFGFHMAEFDTAVRYDPPACCGDRERRRVERRAPDPAPVLWGAART
jgi:hypothetical protein